MPTARYPTLPATVSSLSAIPLTATTTRCPICGRPLERPGIATTHPTTAPWLCSLDSQGFWNVELSAPARRAFRPSSRDFGFTGKWIRDAVKIERGA
jgi:hypothetical protein